MKKYIVRKQVGRGKIFYVYYGLGGAWRPDKVIVAEMDEAQAHKIAAECGGEVLESDVSTAD